LSGVGGKMNVELCYLSTAFRYVNAFADWMSLGMIALSRSVIFSENLGQVSQSSILGANPIKEI